MAFGGGFQSQPRQQQDITNTLVQTVKQDVDLCEKGKQWTFSCYSPAKETACVPGIEDVSPEEMRLDAYQARLSGKVDEFQRRYQQLVSDYAVKWRAMLNPNEALKDVLRKIYNRENLVGVNPAALFQQASSGGGGIFGGATTTSPFQSGGSIFGGGQAAPPAAAAAAATSSGIFGGKPVFGSPLFGGTASSPSAPATAAPGSSIFGGGGGAASGSSVFGGRPAAAAGGIFSGQAAQPQQPPSIFGGGGGGGGGQGPATVFGQPTAGSTASPSIFGGPPAFGSTPAPGQGAFGQASSSGPIFGQAPQQFGQSQRPQSPLLQQSAGPLQSSIFGQASSSPSQAQPSFSSLATGGSQQSVFGSPSTAAPAASSPYATNSGALGTAATQTAPSLPVQPSPPGGSIFGSAAPQAQAAQSIFGSTSAPTAPSPFSPVTPSAASPAATGATVFGAPAASSSAPGGTIFGAPSSGVAAGSGTAGLFGKVIKPQIDPSRFTPLEELTPEELAEFTAEHFTLGKIPERPPPKQFCVAAA